MRHIVKSQAKGEYEEVLCDILDTPVSPELLPPEESNDFCHRIVLHGRAICIARRPKCEICNLKIACKSCEITHLNYVGADIVLDKNKGALLLELNARPGLAIQIANKIGLKKRLELVDNNLNLIKSMSNEDKFNFILDNF